jgi:hypothetical protein
LVRTSGQNKSRDFNAVQRRAAKSVSRIAARFFCPKFQRQHMHPNRIFEENEGSFSLGHTEGSIPFTRSFTYEKKAFSASQKVKVRT